MKNKIKFIILFVFLYSTYKTNAQISYAEDFENGLGIWSGTYHISTSSPCEANSSARDNIYTSSGGQLTSGVLGVSNGGQITLDFMYKITNWIGGGPTPANFGVTEIQYSASASGPWTTVHTIDVSNHTPSTFCTSVNVTFNPFPGDMYMRFFTTYYSGDYYFYIDDIEISQGPPPSCPRPSALTTTNITTNGADIGWTTGGAANWNIEYGPAGFTHGSGTIATNVTSPYSLSMLTPNTDYDVYIQDSCGVGDVSVWSKISFTTFPGMHPFPLMEDFEDSILNFENQNSLVGTPWVLTSALAHSGSQSAYNGYGSNNNNVLHETGFLDLTNTGAPVIEFWHIAKTQGGWDKCYVQISTDGGATYSNIPSSAYRGSGAYPGYFHEDSYTDWRTFSVTPDNSWWKKEKFDLSAYNNASGVRFRFVLESDGFLERDGWYIDDIHIFEPTCPSPHHISSSYSNVDSLVLNWNPGYQETMWNIEYGEAGFVQGTGTIVAVTDPTDTITELDLGAVYQFYVQADCGGGDVSDWAGPFIYATPIINDTTCDAVFIAPNTDFSPRLYSNIGSTLQLNESALPGTQQNTVWFKTVVPTSGHLLIATCGSEFNTIVGAYAHDTIICDSLETYVQIAYSSSNYSLCGQSARGSVEICGETPGDTILFYVGGSNSSQSGIINLTVSDYGLDGYAGEGPLEPLSVCAGDTIDLWSHLSNELTDDGDWVYESNPLVIVNDTMANTGAFTLTGNSVYYIVSHTCDADTAAIEVNVFTESNSGVALSNFQGCSNGDVFLSDGLTGTIDAGGTWGDDTNTGLLNGNKFVANGLPNGPYQFTYTVSDGVCPPASTQVTVNLVDCTNIKEGDIDKFSIYPNPNKGLFYLANNIEHGDVEVKVFNVQGQILYQKKHLITESVPEEVFIKNIKSGVYLLQIESNNQVFTKNMIVQ